MPERINYKIKFLAFAAIIILLWSLARFIDFAKYTGAIESFLKSFPLFYASIIYIALYVIVTFFVFFSKDVFWLAGAFIFGVGLSTLLISISEIINACILFYLARGLGRSFVEKKTPEKYRYLDENLGCLNFAWLFVFRAAPLIPYRFMDLAAGLTKIDFRRYILAAVLGTPVKMFWIQFVLRGVGKNILVDPNLLVEYFLRDKIMLLIGLVYLFLVILVIIKMKSKDKPYVSKH